MDFGSLQVGVHGGVNNSQVAIFVQLVEECAKVWEFHECRSKNARRAPSLIMAPMCGRYTLTQTEELGDFFEISDTRLPPRFNVAPTQEVPVVRLTPEGERELVTMRWGLLDEWSAAGETGHINARSESVTTKPAFARAFERRRCLVPADGFFEWQKAGGVSHPYYVRRRDHGLFALAGIWEPGSPYDSFAVLTCDAPPLLESVHHRMPVMLRREQAGLWLDPDADEGTLRALLAPYPEDLLQLVPVGRVVNRVANDGPECIEPAHHQVQGSLF